MIAKVDLLDSILGLQAIWESRAARTVFAALGSRPQDKYGLFTLHAQHVIVFG